MSSAKTLCHKYKKELKKQRRDKQKDKKDREKDLQEIMSDVPKAARTICRNILDHGGIFRHKSVKSLVWF